MFGKTGEIEIYFLLRAGKIKVVKIFNFDNMFSIHFLVFKNTETQNVKTN